ncbi:gastrokine-2-like [Pluvialis apricaria]
MNGFAAILVLLGVVWTQTSALELSRLRSLAVQTILLEEPDDVTVAVTVAKDMHIVNIQVRSGLYSSDTIIDYAHGYIAIRLFSRSACFIMKINKESIPELQEIQRLALERQNTNTARSPKNLWLQFQSGHSVRGSNKDWLLYGKPIEQTCTGLPLYQLADTQRVLA